MENKKQSSIDWFLNEFSKQIEFVPESELDKWFKELIPKAKAMHKEEILQTFEKGYVCGYRDNGDGGIDYYNEIFGGQE